MLGWLVGCSMVPVPASPAPETPRAPPPAAPAPPIRFGGPCRAEYDYHRAGGGMVPDGIVDQVDTYEWDARHFLVGLREEQDGVSRRIESYAYDGAGRLASRHLEAFGPGPYVQVQESQRDAAGRLVRVTKKDPATDRQWVTTHRYDELGRRTLLTDGGGEGGTTFRERFVYEGDRLVRIEVDNAGNGTFPLTERQEHDAEGRVIRRVHEWSDRDDNPTEIDVFEYDAAGRLSRSVDQRPYGREPDPGMAEVFDYDGAGNVVAKRTVSERTGTVTARVTYDYGCWAGLGEDDPLPYLLEPFEVSRTHRERVTELSF